MIKKLMACVCAAALMLCCFAGCTDAGVRSYSGSASSASPTPASDEDAARDAAELSPTLDYDAARAKYDPDTVVMTVDGIDVPWSEYFYWLYYNVSNLESSMGSVVWGDISSANDEMTNQDYILSEAQGLAVQYRAIESNAQAAGVKLDAADEETLAQMWQDEIDTYGSGDEATFIAYLESMYLSKDMDDYFNRISQLYSNAFEHMYGEGGADLSDEEALAYAADAGYMCAKHILLKTVDDEGAALPDEEKAAKKATADDLLAQLQAAADDPDAQRALFDKLLEEYGEDTGTAYYPEGYVFGDGEMVEQFETAVKGLEENQISDIVETDYGYHIILRLPLDPEVTVEYYSETESYSLRYLAAWNMYNATVQNWFDEAEVVYAEGFEHLDLSTIFDTYTTVDDAADTGDAASPTASTEG